MISNNMGILFQSMFELKYLINHFFQLISPAQTATLESLPLDYSAHFVDTRILFYEKLYYTRCAKKRITIHS